MSEDYFADWNELISKLPGRHILQTKEWGNAKIANRWNPIQRVWRHPDGSLAAAAQILIRSISFSGLKLPMRIMYIPRGPLIDDWCDSQLRRRVLADLYLLGKEHRAVFIKIDPEIEFGRGVPGSKGQIDNPQTDLLVEELRASGWVPSPEQIQFKNTVTLDLKGEPEQLLANMKQKTRYNIRLAERRGVTIKSAGADDLDLLYQMYAETSLRDNFTIRNQAYYLSLWKNFIDCGMAEPLIAEVDGEPVAAVIIFRFAGRSWYMFGMSSTSHREKMPNYLLQWHAILSAKESGCLEYDLWGAPDEFLESSELWGVYRFKEGLGGQVVRYIGAWDLPINKLFYRVYMQMMPRLLAQMRRRGLVQTKDAIQAG